MKGISNLISAVLLLAVAVSVAGVYSNWAPDLAKQATEKASNQAGNELKCDNAGIYLKDASYDKTGNTASIRIENTGTIDFLDDITVYSINSSAITGSNKVSELSVGEEQLVEIDTEKTPDEMTVTSKSCPELESSTESIEVSR